MNIRPDQRAKLIHNVAGATRRLEAALYRSRQSDLLNSVRGEVATLWPTLTDREVADLAAQATAIRLSAPELTENGLPDRILRALTTHHLPPAAQSALADLTRVAGGFPPAGPGLTADGVYERFASEYEPARRMARGLYLTPGPLISYVMRSAMELARDRFPGRPVTVWDPACGTGSFLHAAAELGASGLAGHEISPVPLLIARMRLASCVDLTLSPGNPLLGPIPPLAARSPDTLVVAGNPPYAGHSGTPSSIGRGDTTWIGSLLSSYQQQAGRRLAERNYKWLQDDYVKFLRMADWYLEQRGRGIIALVVNHAFIDNPTFRLMRQHLMASASDLFVLDLHGNKRRRERAPTGEPDDNLFPVMQGTAVIIAVREEPAAHTRVHHCDLWGRRDDKARWLSRHTTGTTAWTPVKPLASLYLLRPTGARAGEYEAGWPLTAIMPVHSVGIVTGRDALAIAFNRRELTRRLGELLDPAVSDEEIRARYLSSRDRLDLAVARRELRAHPEPDRLVLPCWYRPFDRRWILYHPAIIERNRYRIMQHLVIPGNVAVLAKRQSRLTPFSHAWCADGLAEGCVLESSYANNTVFPLLLQEADGTGTTVNLSPEFLQLIRSRTGLIPGAVGRNAITPQDIVGYIYAILHSPRYRERYRDHLTLDFPRIPLTGDPELMQALASIGNRLLTLHLGREPVPTGNLTGCPVAGSNLIPPGYPRHAPGEQCPDRHGRSSGRVYINDRQYVAGVAPDVWEFQAGGYRVCERWLRDRRGRTLSPDDIDTYVLIIASIAHAARLMSEIDRRISDCGGWPLP